MSGHTQGRLKAYPCVGTFFLFTDDERQVVVASGVGAGLSQEEQEANARRLAAAWNACEGIPTEALDRLIAMREAAEKDEEALK